MRLTSLPAGVKEELILSSPAAPDRFVFPLKLKGLTASIEENGDVVYKDSSGKERARTPRGYMYDSKVDVLSDEPAYSQGVTFALIAHGKGQALEVRLDRMWLDSPERIYPVVVDPEVYVVRYSGDETYVMSPYSTNYSSDPELKVGSFNGGANKARTFIRFDTSAFSRANVTSAYLYAYENHSYNCGVGPGGAFKVTGGWNSSTTTQMPGPTTAGGVGGVWSGTSCGTRVAYWDIVGMSREWAAGGVGDGSVSLRAWNENNSHEWKKYKSNNTSTGPFIVVYYNNLPPDTPTNVTPGHQTVQRFAQVALGARYSDPQGTAGSIAFYVYRYPTNELAWVGWSPQVGSGSMAYATTSALPDDWYYVRTVAYDGQDISGWSSDQYFFLDTQRPTVTWLSPAVNSTVGSPVTVTARYDEPYNLPGQVLFAVNRLDGSQAASGWSQVVNPGQTASANLTIAQPGPYDFYAISNDGGGDINAYSTAWSGPYRMTVAGAPGPVTNLAATVDPTVGKVSWTPPANNGGSPVTDVVVTATGGGVTKELHCNTPTCLASRELWFTGLVEGPVTFVAKAINVIGSSGATSSSATVPGLDLLKPTAVTATRGDSEATVRWTPPVLNLPLLINYTVKTYPGSGEGALPPTATTSGTTAVVSGLQNGTPVKFRVQATVQLLGIPVASGPESEASNTVTPAGRPLEPGNVVATGGDGQASVTWNLAGDNGEPPSGYSLVTKQASDDQVVNVQESATSPSVVPVLQNGRTYYFEVFATNSVGSGSSGRSNSVTPAGKPFAPVNLQAQGAQRRITLNWEPAPARDGIPGNNGSPVTGHTVVLLPTCDQCSGKSVSGTSFATVVEGLKPATTYTIEIVATNSKGSGDRSLPAQAETDREPPEAPTNVRGISGTSSATIEWEAPLNLNGSVLTGYSITVNPDCAGCTGSTITDPGTTSSEISGLSNNVSYTFQVTANSNLGPGQMSVPSMPLTPHKFTYWALGDSYSSGQGAGPYRQDGTDCMRSENSYAPLLAAAHQDDWDFEFKACQGKTTVDITNQINLMPGYTDLITVSIGGNNLGWGEVLYNCMMPGDCREDYGPDESDIRNIFKEINDMEETLTGVYGNILRQAPNAKLIIFTYPQSLTNENKRIDLIPNPGPGPDPVPARCMGDGLLTIGEIEWLRERFAQFNRAIVNAANAVDSANNTQNIEVIRLGGELLLESTPSSAAVIADGVFDGHQVCNPDEWITGLTPNNSPQEIYDALTQNHREDLVKNGRTFHPTAQGYVAMHSALQSLLGAM